MGLVGLAAALCIQPAAAAPGPAELEQALVAFNARAVFPLPTPSSNDLDALAAGKLVRMRDRVADADDTARVIALKLIPEDKDVLWVAARDTHYSALDSLREICLCDNPAQGTRWYQYLDLPWPFDDRHWVIDVWDNHDLAAATDGAAWEHPWKLVEGGPELASEVLASGRVPEIEPQAAEKAVYTPVNRGAWVAITVADGHTLLGYHVATVVGGGIPDNLVAKYTAMTFRSLYKGIEDRMQPALEHYDDAHAPMLAGDGTPIPPWFGRR